MQALLQSYGIFDDEFVRLMRSTRAVIAGSSVLSVINKDFEPNDIDIWVEAKNDEVYRLIEQLFYNFMYSKNYIKLEADNEHFESNSFNYREISDFAGEMYAVKTFINNEGGKKVQILITKSDVTSMIKNFDLSVCACWCEIYNTGFCELKALDIENTKKKVMYSLQNRKQTDREKQRVQKYIERGYKLVSLQSIEEAKYIVCA